MMNYSEIAHDVAELWHGVDVVEVCSTHVIFSVPKDSEQIVAALYDSIFDCGGLVKDAPPVVEVFEHYNEITFYWEHNAC